MQMSRVYRSKFYDEVLNCVMVEQVNLLLTILSLS